MRGIEFKGEGGFSVRVSKGGKCVGKGTVEQGRTGYISQKTYDMGDLNSQAERLTLQIEELGIY